MEARDIKWCYVDKRILTNAMKNYKDEEEFDGLFENTFKYKMEIQNYKKTGEKAEIHDGGYGRFPMYYIIDNIESKVVENGGTPEQYRFLFCLSAYICTFSLDNCRITYHKINEYSGLSIKESRTLIESHGSFYGIKWSKEKNIKNGRNLYYASIDFEAINKITKQLLEVVE